MLHSFSSTAGWRSFLLLASSSHTSPKVFQNSYAGGSQRGRSANQTELPHKQYKKAFLSGPNLGFLPKSKLFTAGQLE